MTGRSWTALAGTLLVLAALGGCACDESEPGPPSASDVDVPPLSDQDRSLLDEDDGALPDFVASTATLPVEQEACEAALPGLAEASIGAREVATELEDDELQGLMVNHSAAAWDYLRLCAAGEDTTAITEELRFYQEVIERWID